MNALVTILWIISSLIARQSECDESYLEAWQSAMDSFFEINANANPDGNGLLDYQMSLYQIQTDLLQEVPPACAQDLHIHTLTFLNIYSRAVTTIFWNEYVAAEPVDLTPIQEKALELRILINEDLSELGWPKVEWK